MSRGNTTTTISEYECLLILTVSFLTPKTRADPSPINRYIRSNWFRLASRFWLSRSAFWLGIYSPIMDGAPGRVLSTTTDFRYTQSVAFRGTISNSMQRPLLIRTTEAEKHKTITCVQGVTLFFK